MVMMMTMTMMEEFWFFHNVLGSRSRTIMAKPFLPRSSRSNKEMVAAGDLIPHAQGIAPTRATTSNNKPLPHHSYPPAPNLLITRVHSSPLTDHQQYEDDDGNTHQRNCTNLLLPRSFSCEATDQIPLSPTCTSRSPHNSKSTASISSQRRRLQRANSCMESNGKKRPRSKMCEAVMNARGDGARGLRSLKSLSELELEEVQGFMDLGFVFDKANLSPSILSIIPGLQERKHADDQLEDEISSSDQLQIVEVARPYLSEAWLMQRPPRLPKLLNSVDGNGKPAVDLEVKEQLKEWAKSVASSVRRECCT